MKTAKQIQNEIDLIIREHIASGKELKGSAKANVKNLKLLKRYIETGVTESFVKNELNELTDKICIIENRFEMWRKYLTPKEIAKYAPDYRKVYRCIMNIPYLVNQKKSLEYLFS